MPTVIDSLIVELGLDPKQFNDGQKKAADAFLKLKNQAEDSAKKIEAAGKRSSDAFVKVAKEALAAFAAFEGAKAVADFTLDTAEAEASVRNLSRSLGLSANELANWQNVAKTTGGTSEDITSSISGLVKGFNEYSITRQSPLLPYFAALTASTNIKTGFITKPDGSLDLEKYIENTANALKKLNDTGPGGAAKAADIASHLGWGQSLINLIPKGSDGIKAALADVNELGSFTNKAAEKAQELDTAWERFKVKSKDIGYEIAENLFGPMTTALNYITGKIDALMHATDINYKPAKETVGGTVGLFWKAFKDTAAEGLSNSESFNEAYIRASAVKYGVDPDKAVAIARSEGLGGKYVGDDGSSFGIFQLHYGGIAKGGNYAPGLGDEFTSRTGLDAKDPATNRAQIEFALQWMAKHGVGDFHGAARAGISDVTIPDTLGAPGAAAASSGGLSSSTTTNETNIGTINVNSPADSASIVAQDIKAEIEKTSFANHANYGAQ